jgi:hypothetical protein
MKKIITRALTSLAFVAAVVALPLASTNLAYAGTPAGPNTVNTACEGVQAAGGAASCDDTQLGKFLKDIVNILLFIIGTISVIMIIVGGLRYVLSGGDQNSVKAGKDTILYAVIGLVVAIMAYAIVNFVLGSFQP